MTLATAVTGVISEKVRIPSMVPASATVLVAAAGAYCREAWSGGCYVGVWCDFEVEKQTRCYISMYLVSRYIPGVAPCITRVIR